MINTIINRYRPKKTTINTSKEIKPKLIEKKILRKLLAKSYKKKKFNQKILIDIKKCVVKNWYYLLIIALIVFILYLRWNDKKEQDKKEKNKKPEKFKNNLYKKMNPSHSYVKDYYNEIQRTQPTVPPQYMPPQ